MSSGLPRDSATARQFLLEQVPSLVSFDDQDPVPRDVFQARVGKQTLRVKGLTRLYGHAVARLVQGTRSGRPQRREREIALLIEQGRAKAHCVGAGEQDHIKILESAQLFREGSPVFERFDFKRRQAQRRRTQRLQQPAQRHGLKFRPCDQDADSLKRRHLEVSRHQAFRGISRLAAFELRLARAQALEQGTGARRQDPFRQLAAQRRRIICAARHGIF